MASNAEIVSAAAAVVSAVGGAFAAWAAYRSADSARASQRAAEEAERRARLRQLAATCSEVITEANRVETRGNQTRLAYNTLAAFSGSLGNSAVAIRLSGVDTKVQRSSELATHARLFVDGASALSQAPSDELDRVQLRESSALVEVRALREELELEPSDLQSQIAQRREDNMRARNAR
jgi:hypothetical protein